MGITVVFLMLVGLIVFSIYTVPLPFNATPERRANPTHDGWFTGGSWDTGWYGPGVAFGIGPPPHNGPLKECQCASKNKPYGSCGHKK